EGFHIPSSAAGILTPRQLFAVALRCRHWRARCTLSIACYLASTLPRWGEPPHAITNLERWTKAVSKDGCQAKHSLACSASPRIRHYRASYHASLCQTSNAPHHDASTRRC
ncbi:hypothetical protein CORC01_05148, partial [Colletotrichum orchidophilum]